MVSYSKHLYATVLRACTGAVDSLDFDHTREFERQWVKIIQAPSVRVRWRNEVLELLGDGVFNACITAEICTSIKGSPSMISMLKSVLSSNILFATITKRMISRLAFPVEKLKAFLNISQDDTIPTKSYADAFETVIGALYRDRGFYIVQSWIAILFKSLIESATNEYHNFRSRTSDPSGQPSRSSRKRKRAAEDEPKLNKRPKFMTKPRSVPVIVDAGSGAQAPLIQDLASILENRLEYGYTRQRDEFIVGTIQEISSASQRYRHYGHKAKRVIDRRLLDHGRKYIRMLLAINDREDDYPDTDEEHGVGVRNVAAAGSTAETLRVIETPPTLGWPQDNGSTSTTEKSIDGPSQFDLDLDSSIREIELIDLIDDSDESDAIVNGISSSEEDDETDIQILSRKPVDKGFREGVADREIISLLSSSEEDELESTTDEAADGARAAQRNGKATVVVMDSPLSALHAGSVSQRRGGSQVRYLGEDKRQRRKSTMISRNWSSPSKHHKGSRNNGPDAHSGNPLCTSVVSDNEDMDKGMDMDDNRDLDEEGFMGDDEGR